MKKSLTHKELEEKLLEETRKHPGTPITFEASREFVNDILEVNNLEYADMICDMCTGTTKKGLNLISGRDGKNRLIPLFICDTCFGKGFRDAVDDRNGEE